MKFIDLFAGIGGFHVALSELGHECVFASEIDSNLQKLYTRNFQLEIQGDIISIDASQIPKHDILCAGFPCQAFSKAGSREGLDDHQRGNLFFDIARILDYHKPKYFILENVANLEGHDNGFTWWMISNTLEELGYTIAHKKLSPHQFGIPQIRERIFIVGSRAGLQHFDWPQKIVNGELDIRSILEKKPKSFTPLSSDQIDCLTIWQNFLDVLPRQTKLPSFPIWAMEFGATYPYESYTPFSINKNELGLYKGAFGKKLLGLSKRDQLRNLPTYAQQKKLKFPKWKKDFIRQNREFYKEFKKQINPLLPSIKTMPPSWQKFEWNCQGEEREISNLIIQFRSSGVRVKKSNYSPALVSSTTTQIPIIGWENRYITVKEAAKLQSLERIILPEPEHLAFRALGNAVNATVVKLIAEKLVLNTKTQLTVRTKDVMMANLL